MRFKAGDRALPTIIHGPTIARMAKERGLTLTDDQVNVIERFLSVMNQPERDWRSYQINADDAEFLESLGIRL